MGLVKESGRDQMTSWDRAFRYAYTRGAYAFYQLCAPARYLRKVRVVQARVSRQTFVAFMRNIKSKMIIDPNTYFSEVYVQGQFEPEVVRYLVRVLRPGMTCIDIGANVGYVTLLMAAQVGMRGRVVAFEPTSHIKRILEANVALNGYKQVVIEQAAVCDHDGDMSFHEGPAGFEVYNSAGIITHPSAVLVPFLTNRVPCLTLDSYVSKFHLPKIDLIKIDVEGGELFVLKGMQQVLESNPGIKLIIEFDDRTTRGFGYSAYDIENWLLERGWCLSLIGAGGRLAEVTANQKWIGQMVVASGHINRKY